MKRMIGTIAMLGALYSGCEPAGESVLEETPEETIWMTQNGDVAQVVAPGVELSGEDGPRVEMIATSPLIEFSGEYTWTIGIDDATALGVDRVTARPLMPDHGHGTLPAVVEGVVTEGEATLEPLNLYMGGIWEVEMMVFAGDDVLSTFSVFIYVEG